MRLPRYFTLVVFLHFPKNSENVGQSANGKTDCGLTNSKISEQICNRNITVDNVPTICSSSQVPGAILEL